MLVVLSIGSNLGDKTANINCAIEELASSVKIGKISSLYESDALLKPNSPKEWDIPYYNLAILGETELSPHKLLEYIKNIEQSFGRNHNAEIWSPRIIDIDIIIYGDEIINEPDLIIPHKELPNRLFVLYPLLDILPEWRYPIEGSLLNQNISYMIETIVNKRNYCMPVTR